MNLRLLYTVALAATSLIGTAQSDDFTVKFGGRLHFQSYAGRQDASLIGDALTGSEMRRIRFEASGTASSVIKYMVELDFAGGLAVVNDVYVDYTGLEIFDAVRIGHFKEPVGLDQLGSSNDMTFIERNGTFDMTPGRNNGIAIMKTYEDVRLGYWFGAYDGTDNFGNGTKSLSNFSGRIHYAPVLDKEAEKYMHLGISGSNRRSLGYDGPNSNFSFATRPESNMAPALLNTGIIAEEDGIKTLGLELAIGHGPLAVQAEYVNSNVARGDGLANLTFDSWYIEGSYFLTGETKNYNLKKGWIERTSPNQNFGQGGRGAVELALRYGQTDFTDLDRDGGEMEAFTAGVNWHLSNNAKLMFNQTFAAISSVGDGAYTSAKIQITF